MNRLTPQVIEQLHNATCSPGLILTCYADLSVQDGMHRPGIGVVKHAASLIKQSIPDNLKDQKEFEKNYDAVLKTLENPEFHHSSAIAIFSANQRDQFEIIPLGIPIRSDLIYHEEPYLVPLLQTFFLQQRRYLVLAFDNNHARLFLADFTGIQPVKEWQSDVPPKQHSSGERGGWSQPGIAHHREALLNRYEQEIVVQLTKSLQAYPTIELILLGHEVAVNQLKHRLPNPLRDRVVQTGTCNHLESETSLRKAIHELIKKQNGIDIKSRVDELKKRQGGTEGFAKGAGEVLQALDDGKLGQKGCLLLGPDPREAVVRCSSCRYLTLDNIQTCPRCGSGCKSCNLWEEFLLRALRHDWNVICIEHPDTLAGEGGVALLFD